MKKKPDLVMGKFLAYLQQEAETYGSYEEAIQMMIDKEKDDMTKIRLYELKKQYRGR